MKHLSKALGGLIAALALALPAQADTVTLAELLRPGASITAGDKLFDNWSNPFYDSSVATRAFNAANILVTSLDDGGDNPGPGLSFSVLNGELTIQGDDLFAFIDLAISFRASVLPGVGKQIKDNSLKLTAGAIQAAGDNGFYIKEFIGTTEGGDDLGDKEVEFSWLDESLGGNGLVENLSDSAVFAPHSQVWVTKNILVWATGSNETASLTGFEQRFSQQNVPEPASYGLAGLALLAAGVARRRRREGLAA